MQLDIPITVQEILTEINAHGAEAYLVGGCVRDLLCGKMPEDWDITTSATPPQIAEIFAGKRLLPTGIAHGTQTLVLPNLTAEITTFRLDACYSDHRHPQQVCFTTDLRQDLGRRDFTINALAYHPQVGLIDCFGGQRDLADHVIRCVGCAAARVAEDALRILRALRFAATLEATIEPQTACALHQHKELLLVLPAERYSREFVKILAGNPVFVFREFADVLRVLLPELPCDLLPAAQRIACAPDLLDVRIALLLQDIPLACATSLLERLALPRVLNRSVLQLLREQTAPLPTDCRTVKLRLQPLGVENFAKLLLLQEILQPECAEQVQFCHHLLAQVLAEKQCYRLADLAINGRDLQGIGLAAGRQLGAVLTYLLQQVIDGKVANNPSELLNLAQQQTQKNG